MKTPLRTGLIVAGIALLATVAVVMIIRGRSGPPEQPAPEPSPTGSLTAGEGGLSVLDDGASLTYGFTLTNPGPFHAQATRVELTALDATGSPVGEPWSVIVGAVYGGGRSGFADVRTASPGGFTGATTLAVAVRETELWGRDASSDITREAFTTVKRTGPYDFRPLDDGGVTISFTAEAGGNLFGTAVLSLLFRDGNGAIIGGCHGEAPFFGKPAGFSASGCRPPAETIEQATDFVLDTPPASAPTPGAS